MTWKLIKSIAAMTMFITSIVALGSTAWHVGYREGLNQATGDAKEHWDCEYSRATRFALCEMIVTKDK